MAREAKGSLLQGKLTLNAAGSATIWASVAAGSYWRLKFGFVNYTAVSAPGSGGSTISLYEIDATNSGVVFTIYPSATYGHVFINFGDEGFVASATGTRLFMNTDSAGTVNAIFTGYSATYNT